MKKKPSSTLDTTIADLRALVADAETLLANAGEDADEETTKLRARLRSALEESQDLYHRARDSAREQIDVCDNYVCSHPYHAIGIAAAAGAIVGMLAVRRS